MDTVLTPARTFGVEEELLFVDPDSGQPVAAVEPALSTVNLVERPDSSSRHVYGDPYLKTELKQEQVEVISPPCRSLEDLKQLIVSGRHVADRAARWFGVRAAALGTSVLAVQSHVTHDARFESMKSMFGLTLKDQLTCGYHIHVQIADDDEGVAVLDRIRPWLPVLLALSSNSPFWNGEDTGFASYRNQVWSRWPSSGPYDIFGSADQYHGKVQSLLNTGVLLDRAMVYFDARLSDQHPTLEVRIADVCMETEHAVAIAAIVRALVETESREWRRGSPPEPIPTDILRLSTWAASRYGVQDNLVNPVLGTPCAAQVAVHALLARVEPVLKAYEEYERVLHAIGDIFSIGTGADFQRDVFIVTKSLEAVVTEAIARTNPTQPADSSHMSALTKVSV